MLQGTGMPAAGAAATVVTSGAGGRMMMAEQLAALDAADRKAAKAAEKKVSTPGYMLARLGFSSAGQGVKGSTMDIVHAVHGPSLPAWQPTRKKRSRHLAEAATYGGSTTVQV